MPRDLFKAPTDPSRRRILDELAERGGLTPPATPRPDGDRRARADRDVLQSVRRQRSPRPPSSGSAAAQIDVPELAVEVHGS